MLEEKSNGIFLICIFDSENFLLIAQEATKWYAVYLLFDNQMIKSDSEEFTLASSLSTSYALYTH